MTKPITVGNMHFSKKRDAEDFFRNMLYKYRPGDRVTEDDGNILLFVIQKHPDAAEKVGCGISHFSVRSGGFGTQCFWVNRIDGTYEKFAMRKCLH